MTAAARHTLDRVRYWAEAEEPSTCEPRAKDPRRLMDSLRESARPSSELGLLIYEDTETEAEIDRLRAERNKWKARAGVLVTQELRPLRTRLECLTRAAGSLYDSTSALIDGDYGATEDVEIAIQALRKALESSS